MTINTLLRVTYDGFIQIWATCDKFYFYKQRLLTYSPIYFDIQFQVHVEKLTLAGRTLEYGCLNGAITKLKQKSKNG